MKVNVVPRLSLNRRIAAVLAVVPLVLAAACANNSNATFKKDNGNGGAGQVVIAGQNYTEMQIMSAMYAALLQKAGYSTTIKTVSTRDIYGPALSSGKVDVVADYASSMNDYLNLAINGPNAKSTSSPNISVTMKSLTKLGKQKNITPLKPAQAQDANAFAVTKKFSQANHVTTTSQLAALGKPVSLAAASDCPTRSDCKLGLEKVYGLKISKFEPLGFGTVQTKDALKSGEVTLGQVGTSDGSLDTNGLVVLKDDRHLQNAENLVPVVNTAFLKAHPDIAPVLNKLSAVLTTDDLKTLNAKVDVERQLPGAVAKQYLKEKGLL